MALHHTLRDCLRKSVKRTSEPQWQEIVAHHLGITQEPANAPEQPNRQIIRTIAKNVRFLLSYHLCYFYYDGRYVHINSDILT